MAKARTAMEGSDLAPLTAAVEELTNIAMKIGEAVYKASQEAAPEAGAQPHAGGKADEKVVDADFEEVDDKRKSA